MTEATSSKYIRSAKGNHPICEGEKGSLSLPTVSSYVAALAVHPGHNSHPNNHLPGKGSNCENTAAKRRAFARANMRAKYLLSIFIVITTSCNADGGCTVCCCLQVGFQALEDKTLVVSINSFLGYKDGQSRFMVSQKPQIPFSTLPAKSIHTGFAHSHCKLLISVIKISELIKNQVTYTLSDTGSCVHFMKLKVCMIKSFF